MFIVGLTGGIGSGKSAASDYFMQQGVVVVDADIVAREIVLPGMPAWQAIHQRLGAEVLLPDEQLNRAWLREKVFADPELRKWLESETHPRIRTSIIQQLQQAQSAYAILTSPLLFESKQAALTAQTLVIDVPESVQLSRASARDENNVEQIKRIMAAQLARAERLKLADDVVDNSGSLSELYVNLAPLHQQYLRLAHG